MKKLESTSVLEPAIEVVIRTGAIEVAVIGIFPGENATWDVVVGISELGQREGVQGALELALNALSSATFGAVRDIKPKASTQDSPFE